MTMALRCGQAMRECAGRSKTSFKDKNAIDPVTETDEENERLVIRTIRAEFPGWLPIPIPLPVPIPVPIHTYTNTCRALTGHHIIGEEASANAGVIPPLTAEPTWIVDPIDGTQNFIHACPLSVVSIGLCIGGEPSLGVVYDPYRDEVFIAITGQGAWRQAGTNTRA